MNRYKSRPAAALHVGLLALIVAGGLVASCKIVRSMRVGGLYGHAHASDGEVPVAAVTVSVEPFAEAEETGPSDQQLELALIQRNEYAAMVADMEGHTCAPEPEHVEPHHPRWWEDSDYLLWLSGFAAMICGFMFRKPIGAAARKVVGR